MRKHPNDDDSRKGGSAPDPMKHDLGRTDDLPQETAVRGRSPNADAPRAPKDQA